MTAEPRPHAVEPDPHITRTTALNVAARIHQGTAATPGDIIDCAEILADYLRTGNRAMREFCGEISPMRGPGITPEPCRQMAGHLDDTHRGASGVEWWGDEMLEPYERGWLAKPAEPSKIRLDVSPSRRRWWRR